MIAGCSQNGKAIEASDLWSIDACGIEAKQGYYTLACHQPLEVLQH